MPSLKALLRYWHTLRHLQPVQIYGRVWFRLARPTPDLAPAPAVRVVPGRFVPPAGRMPSVTGPEEFLLLGEAGNLTRNGWDDPEKSKLWRYNLHYFDDLNAEGAMDRRDWHTGLIGRWVAENSPGFGSGWEPYPVSLRIVNWVKYALTDGALDAAAQHSLAVQSRWLTKRLEWHLLGNHLFANAKALLFAGLYFDGPEAARWRARAVSILTREMPEQILPDGGQFELSPMYHALAVEDVADILNLLTACAPDLNAAEQALAQDCCARLSRMLHWLDAMAHPDGRISFFNDAAFGVAPEIEDLHRYAERLRITVAPLAHGLTHLADSGYVRMARRDAVVLADIGRVGPDYLPGHAHADTLSFELSVGAERVIVNSGTSEYGISSERLSQRGTAAHSTVTVDGVDSSEVWSGFRVARRARVEAVETTQDAQALTVTARHDGYTRLPNGPHHIRRWTLSRTGLVIADRLEPATQGEARYHLPPGVTVKTHGDRGDHGTMHLPSGRMLRWSALGATARLEPATWHPRFGQSLASQCISLCFCGNLTFELDFS